MKKKIGAYIILIVVALFLGYPILWLFFSSFKESSEIFSSIRLLPKKFTVSGYVEGWLSTSQLPFSTYLLNSFKLVIPTVLLTCASSIFVAYGFSRFRFAGKKGLFTLMISTMMLPNTILMIPRYILFQNFGVLNSYMPFYLQAMFATNPFFTYLLIQFFRGIPKDLDESATIDGCSRFRILINIILPLAVTPIISVALFQTMWTWNDFFNALIYIDTVRMYPVSLGLRLAIDADTVVNWGKIIAMTVVSISPLVIMFLFLQRYFVAGIATTGLKG